MATYILTIWLTSNGPELTMPVNDCYGIGRAWYAEAVLWAARSGVERDGPGFMCGRMTDHVWRVSQ